MNNVQNWKNLESQDQLKDIINLSSSKPVAIFKHSTRCSISAMALNRLEREWNNAEMDKLDFYYLDLISHRDVSNKIADELNVVHQSPQLIVVKDGKVIYHTSHMGVSYQELKKQLN